MINIVYSFIGCFFALLINEFIKKKTNTVQPKMNRREIPNSIRSFSDPLMDYKRYKDEDNLFKTYVPKREERRK